jgi:long-chain acyl-CoA synthetase
MLNLAVMLSDTARREPDRLAVIDGNRTFTYGELHAAAQKVARYLSIRGVQPADRVALTIPNIAEFPIVYYGILQAGAVVVPLNAMLKRDEVAYHLRDSGAKAYFCTLPGGDDDAWRGFQSATACEHLVTIGAQGASTPEGTPLADVLGEVDSGDQFWPTEATDTAVILYTSGTTGKPKGAELTHANMVMNAFVQNRLLDARADDIHLVTLPLFHSFGQTVQMNAGFAVGATLVLLPRFNAAAALDLIARHSVSVFAGVPTMYWALLAAADQSEQCVDLSGLLRLAISGGAAMPVEVLARFEKVFGVAIREGYGLSETSPTVTSNPLERPNKPGSIGQPIWGIEARLIDRDWNEVAEGEAGELAVRGHNVMKGYLGRPEATAEVIRDGWFRTGDIATRDEDGYYFIIDRAKDLIVRGGFNVYPREVEETLGAHPDVSLVAVVGVPDDRVGEEVKAFVIRRPGSELTADDLIAWCRERLAAYKCPRSVEFRESLPMNATGKLLKRELR